MIEEIKKELLDYATHDCEILGLHSKRMIKGISTEEIVKILDKYKDIDKYKNAWEEIGIIINHRLLDKVDFKSICDRNGIKVKK